MANTTTLSPKITDMFEEYLFFNLKDRHHYFYRDFCNRRDDIVDLMKQLFLKDTETMSSEEKTKFAQSIINIARGKPDLYDFYLDQMTYSESLPADKNTFYPIIFDFKFDKKTELTLLYKTIVHPCYKPYLCSQEYICDEDTTFLEDFMIKCFKYNKEYSFELEEMTLIKNILKEDFPEQFSKYIEYLEKCYETGEELRVNFGEGYPIFGCFLREDSEVEASAEADDVETNVLIDMESWDTGSWDT